MIAYFCVEDPLSRAVLVRLIRDLLEPVELIELQANQGGFGTIRKKFRNYCELARRKRVFILTDLDRSSCAPSLRDEWIADARCPDPLPAKMSFHIAVTEVEAWLIADRNNLGAFLGVSPNAFPANTEMQDPKEFLISIVRRHGSRDAKAQLLPTGRAKVGLGYNVYLSTFAAERWNFTDAAARSPSLRRAVMRIQSARI